MNEDGCSEDSSYIFCSKEIVWHFFSGKSLNESHNEAFFFKIQKTEATNDAASFNEEAQQHTFFIIKHIKNFQK